MTTYCRGVDVSSWNDLDVPDGLDFVWIKATQGNSYINPKMKEQADSARAKGYIVCFYHFLVPTVPVAEQMAYFVAHALSQEHDPLGIDWEKLPDETFASCAEKDAALDELKKLRPGHRTVLYCNLDFWLKVDTTSKCGDGLWIADPDAPEGHPRVKHPWIFHQYSASPMDLDVSSFQHRMDLKTWAELGTVAVSVPAQPPAPQPEPPASGGVEGGAFSDMATVFCHAPNCQCGVCVPLPPVAAPVPAPAAPAPLATYTVTVMSDGTLKVVKQ